jgi:type VI secretion system secreted protein Hcp
MVKPLRPSSLSRTLALVPPTIALVAQQASGAFDVFIKIGDIKGESTEKGHEGWIELQSMQWGVGRGISSPAGGADREASAPSISELTLSKTLDSSTPKLFLNAVGGSGVIPEVELHLVDTSNTGGPGTVFYTLKLYNVLVSGLSTSAAAGSDRPQESISLNFTKIEMKYFIVDENGGLSKEAGNASYDLATAKSL